MLFVCLYGCCCLYLDLIRPGSQIQPCHGPAATIDCPLRLKTTSRRVYGRSLASALACKSISVCCDLLFTSLALPVHMYSNSALILLWQFGLFDTTLPACFCPWTHQLFVGWLYVGAVFFFFFFFFVRGLNEYTGISESAPTQEHSLSTTRSPILLRTCPTCRQQVKTPARASKLASCLKL